jgi:glutathione S-transferase
VPCLVTPEGNLSESNAIARFIARQGEGKNGLLGQTSFETAQVDAWVDFCVQDLEIPATLWIAPLLGWMSEVCDL